MLRSLLAFLLFTLSTLAIRAQKNKNEDVLHLVNNWVLRGRIIMRTDSSVQIQTHDGNIFSFPASQVQNITTETAWSLQTRDNNKWTFQTELGPLIAGKTTIQGVTTAAFSFQTLAGYRFCPGVMAGIGAGADLYATQTVLPLFATLRGDLVHKSSYSLFAFGDGGYGLNITQQTADATTYKGGLLYAAGLGIRIPFNNTAGFLLSFGYRYQKTIVSAGDVPSPVIYRRLALRAGFYL